MKTPEVRIYFSWLLYDKVSSVLIEKYGDGTQKLAPKAKCFEWAENYSKEWAKYSDRILLALMEATGLEFYKQTIDAACAPWFSAQSEPLIFGFYYEPDQFVDQLTHELCHVLLTDNTIYAQNGSPVWINLSERWTKYLGEHGLNTTIHIPVHALCKYVFTDVLKQPERVDRDVADCKGNKPYEDSWAYVNTHDYKEIIAQIKIDYQKLKEELA